MKRVMTCLFMGTAALVLSVTAASAYDWTISNESRWDIHRVFISSCSSNNWGSDRLSENDIMSTGETYTLSNVSGGCYDVKFVDEDGDSCVVPGVRIHGDLTWTMTDRILLSCENN